MDYEMKQVFDQEESISYRSSELINIIDNTLAYVNKNNFELLNANLCFTHKEAIGKSLVVNGDYSNEAFELLLKNIIPGLYIGFELHDGDLNKKTISENISYNKPGKEIIYRQLILGGQPCHISLELQTPDNINILTKLIPEYLMTSMIMEIYKDIHNRKDPGFIGKLEGDLNEMILYGSNKNTHIKKLEAICKQK